MLKKTESPDAVNTAEACYTLHWLLYFSSLPLAKLDVSVNLEQETLETDVSASNTRHKDSTPTELFEGDFFPLLNINKCL